MSPRNTTAAHVKPSLRKNNGHCFLCKGNLTIQLTALPYAHFQAQTELKAAMRAYLLRRVSLDDALSESITQRIFDWDTDMRRMMDTIKVQTSVRHLWP